MDYLILSIFLDDFPRGIWGLFFLFFNPQKKGDYGKPISELYDPEQGYSVRY